MLIEQANFFVHMLDPKWQFVDEYMLYFIKKKQRQSTWKRFGKIMDVISLDSHTQENGHLPYAGQRDLLGPHVN